MCPSAHALAALRRSSPYTETQPSSLRRSMACLRLKHTNQAFVRHDRFDDTIIYSSKANLERQKKRKIKPSATRSAAQPITALGGPLLVEGGRQFHAHHQEAADRQVIDF